MAVIVVFGLPGTGKSFLAQRLSDTLQVPYFNTDIVREQAQKKGNYTAEDKQRIYENMLDLAEDALRHHTHVVIDGTFSKKPYRNLVTRLAKNMKQTVVWIRTEADDAVVRERVSHQREHSEADYQVYQKIKATFEETDFPYLALDSGKLTVEQMIQQSLPYMHD